jgi:transposase
VKRFGEPTSSTATVFVDGHSIRQIARDGHHDRRTVRKALHDAGPPLYMLQEPRQKPVLGLFAARIDQWLKEDLTRPPKQRHTARRIYHRLIAEHGFTGGESTVREYVRERRLRPLDRFIPLAYAPGQDAQADFGEAQVVMAGQRRTVQFLCLRLCYSKVPFVIAFPHQRQEAFFEGHAQAFSFFGGVPRIIWYDHLSQAVKPGRKAQEQDAFTAFRSHYLFASRFCTPGEAHEKGLVENLVGYARRNFLVPLPEVASFPELNALPRERCLAEAARRLRGEVSTIGELWAQERPHLLPVPARAFPCCRTVPVVPNRLSLVTFETNRYSVPVTVSQRHLFLRAFVDQVEITDGTQVVASHPRSGGREQDVLDPMHYLPLLRERPGAFDHAKPLKTWPHPPVLDAYLAALLARLPHRTATLQYLDVLELVRTHTMPEVGAAVEQAMRSGSLGAETVAYFLRLGTVPPQGVETPILTGAPPCPSVQDRDLRQYNLLLTR